MAARVTGRAARLAVAVVALALMVSALMLTPANAAPDPGPSRPSLAQSLAELPAAHNSEAKLQPNTVSLLRLVEKLWPYYAGEGAIYGWREDPIPDHPSGQALDIMMRDGARTPESVAEGHGIAAFLMANATQLRITYLVWRQHIWYPGREWRLLDDRGDWTSNHMDHIHVLVDGQHVPSGALILPGEVGSGGRLPSLAAVERAYQQKIAALRKAVRAATRTLAQAKVKARELDAQRGLRAADVDAARQRIGQSVREFYMFGADLQLAESMIGFMDDPGAVSMSGLVLERVDQVRRDAYEAAKSELERAARKLKLTQVAVGAASESVAGAEQQLADMTSPLPETPPAR